MLLPSNTVTTHCFDRVRPCCIGTGMVNSSVHTTETVRSKGRGIPHKFDIGQAGATIECMISNISHTLRDGNIAQVTAAIERPSADAGHTIWDGNAGEAPTASKRPFTNFSHTVWDNQIGYLYSIQI